MQIFPPLRMLLALMAVAGALAGLQPANAADAAAEALAANKAAVRGFYDQAFNGQDPQGAVDKYVGAYYRQHNPMAGDGAEAFVEFVTAYTAANPDLSVEFKRFIAEGDLVVVHCNIRLTADDPGSAVMDIFRLEDGKIVEHWDVVQPVPAEAANGNTMF